MSELREALASEIHDIWVHWMTYLLSCGTRLPTGELLINASAVERWKRQMVTQYGVLTEREKESDRDQADKIMKACALWVDGQLHPIESQVTEPADHTRHIDQDNLGTG